MLPELPEPDWAGYSIDETSELTGVSPHALLAWERRYGFPRRESTGSGRYRYTKKDVRMIKYLFKQAEAGRAIGEMIIELRSSKATPESPDTSRGRLNPGQFGLDPGDDPSMSDRRSSAE